MITLLLQLLVSLSISSLIVLMLVCWLTKRKRVADLAYVESMLEIIPCDATSHSISNIIEPSEDTSDV